MAHSTDGFIETHDRRIYYRMFSGGTKTPLLTFHGGPGATHRQLLNLQELANDRPVIFYDQFCCGKSSHIGNNDNMASRWTMENFVTEIDIIRKKLNLDRVHLLGASFGTMLIADYLATRPTGIQSIVFSNPIFSAKRWKDDADRLRQQLPSTVQMVLTQHETAGTTDSVEYETAMMEYYKRFVCRLDPWPEELLNIFKELNRELYLSMWGPSEFYPTGCLKNYDQTNILRDITVPTLFICGRYDEATPETSNYYHQLTPHSQLEIFEHSSHLTLLEEKELYLLKVRHFLSNAD